MKRIFLDYLEDILTAIDEINDFTRGYTAATFTDDRKTINAVIRSLEVIGEAARQIPEEVRRQTPGIPWKYMAGMRDKLIHHYFGIDLEIVWKVSREELPALRPEIIHLLDLALSPNFHPSGRREK